MKKTLLLATLITVATPVWAQSYGGYQQPVRQQYQQPAGYYQPATRQQAYQPQAYQPAQQNYQRQNQQVRYGDYGNAGTYGAYGTQRAFKADKRFYVTPRLGGSYTNFSNADFDGGFGLMGNIAAGMYWGNGRADIEFGYHFDRELGESYVELNQMDFLLNGYYDFKNNSKLTPFVGASIGMSKTELSVDLDEWGKYSASESNFTLGISGGASYALNDTISLEAMVRGKYIFCEGDLFDVEALAGVRFSF